MKQQKVQPSITGIDTHAHIFTPELPMVSGRRYSPSYSALLSEWFAHQDSVNISHGVLIQPSFLGTDNSYIENALLSAPTRLRAIAVVDHTSITEQELDRLHGLGFVGIRLNLVGKELENFEQEAWQRFFKQLEKRQWQVEIQRNFDDLAACVPAIARSGVNVVVDHFGLPKHGIDTAKAEHADLLKVLRNHPNIWLKLSAPYRADLTLQSATQVLEIFENTCAGLDRFLWGSDWPHTQHESTVNYQNQFEFFKQLIPNANDREKILVDNAKTLFQFN